MWIWVETNQLTKKIEDIVFTEQSPYSVNYSNKNYNNNYKLGQQGADIIKKNNEFYNYSSALSQIQGDKNVNWKSIEYFSVTTTF